MFLALTLFTPPLFAEECSDWFKKQKIQPGKDCIMDCAMAPTDMGSFECSNQCDELCKSTYPPSYLFSLSELYPGLTDAERALVAAEPAKMVQAYKLSWKAEDLCNKIYLSSRLNDESDACRHFVWSSLLVNDVGEDFSKRVLNAHEQAKDQPEDQKEMDSHNNEVGLKAAKSMIKSKTFFEDRLLGEFEKHLKKKDFIILKERKAQ